MVASAAFVAPVSFVALVDRLDIELVALVSFLGMAFLVEFALDLGSFASFAEVALASFGLLVVPLAVDSSIVSVA